MNLSLEQFMQSEFPDLWGSSDITADAIDVWNYEGDRLLFTLIDAGEGDYTIRTWHPNNRDAKHETTYIGPNRDELIAAIQHVLLEANEPVKVWARVGMTAHLTKKQIEAFEQGDVTASQMLQWIKAGVFRLDGETYFPDANPHNAAAFDGELDIQL